MTKSRRRSRAAKRRPRDSKGHFIKARETPRRRRRRVHARDAAPKANPTRRRRNPWPGDHRGHVRAARKWVRRKARLRARRRAQARKNFGHARRRRRRSRRHVSHAAPRRRRSSRRRITAIVPAAVRRRGGSYAPTNIRVSVGTGARGSRRRSRSHGRRRGRKSHRRGFRAPRYEGPRQLPPHVGEYALANPLSGSELALAGFTGLLGYLLGDFVGRYMDTTTTGATAPGSVGMLGSASTPTGAAVPNDVATLAFPSLKASAAQFVVALVPGVAQGYMESPMGRASMQGLMLGAGLAWLGSLGKGFVAKMLSNTVTGQQLYLAEIEAQAAATAATGTSTATPASVTATGSFAGLPRGVGRRPDPGPRAPQGVGQPTASAFAPAGQRTRMGSQSISQSLQNVLLRQGLMAVPVNPNPNAAPPPVAPPSMVATVPDPENLTSGTPGIQTNTGEVVATPTVGGAAAGHAGNPASAGPGCGPCTSMAGGLAATFDTARRVAQNPGLAGVPMGNYAMFPED